MFKRRKNRRKTRLLKVLVVLSCLTGAVVTGLVLFGAGANSVQAEAAKALPRSQFEWLVPGMEGDVTAKATVAAELSPYAAPSLVSEPVDIPELALPSILPQPAELPAAPVKMSPVAFDSHKQEIVQHLTTPVKPVVKAVEVKPVEVKAVEVKPVEKPVEMEKGSPIPTFENTLPGREAEAEVKGIAVKSEETPVWRTLLSVFMNLVLVVVLAYASILALKWFMSHKEKPSSKGSGLRLVESISLGANRSLHVVECSGKRLILASTPNQVNLISESEAAVEQPVGQNFDSYLQNCVATQSQIDSAALKVGQALRDGAAFLLKKANESRSFRNKKSDEKND